jgi:GGDEF domain-containing protein
MQIRMGNLPIRSAERLRSQVESTSKRWEFPVTISIGIVTYPSDGTTADELLPAMEKAAKQSKDNRKNQIMAFATDHG